ncbi:hypothetical protein V6N13_036964 [Hibiscus sabdariffa]
MSIRVRVVAQTESKESVNGSRRSAYRQVVGVKDEAKREVLSSCAVAWFGAVFLLRFSDEEDRYQVLGRPDHDRWFVKVEAWKPDLRIDIRSAWLPVVVEETIELVAGMWSGRIRVQEVEVVHSHDLLCECDDTGTVVSSEADKVGGETLRVVRDNPVFVLSADVLALGGQVRDRATCGETWNEWVGLADRVMESASERFDVVWCETALEQPRSSPVVFGWPSVFEFQISNLDSSMAKDNALSTALTYTEDDLVPVPIKVATDVSEQGVELVVVEGSVRKVRSVNDLVLNTGSEEQKQTLVKAKKEGSPK